jgi:UDP-N-acetylmuramate dehydrogenase
MNTLQKERLQALVEKAIQWDCPLREYTSFGIGGPAQALVSVENCKELQHVLYFLNEENILWRVIGRGTNILVKDQGFEGVALLLSGEFMKFSFDQHEECAVLKAGAGHSLSKLSSMCIDEGYTGLEFAIGIPGSVGGAVIMNAGAWGGEIADALLEIELQTASAARTCRQEDLQFGYRTSRIVSEEAFVISSATFALRRGERERIRSKCREYLDKRKKSQPAGHGNAGSFFKNPQGDSAGRLIDASGMKGITVGGAEISKKHANFIINRGGASADDIVQLMELVIDTVYRDSGIRLEPEVQIW